jgi:hypothetical protein
VGTIVFSFIATPQNSKKLALAAITAAQQLLRGAPRPRLMPPRGARTPRRALDAGAERGQPAVYFIGSLDKRGRIVPADDVVKSIRLAARHETARLLFAESPRARVNAALAAVISM